MDAYQIVESLEGLPCFAELKYWRRLQTAAGIALALKALRGVSFRQTFSRIYSESVEAQPAVTENKASLRAKSFDDLLAESYARDAHSQFARTALRGEAREAVDEDDSSGDDSDELSPELTAFRERAFFQFERV